MTNSVNIIGHLGSDPVTRVTAKGIKITTFSVASNSRKAGEDVTIWWRITIWGDQFDYLLPYLRKGSGVFITGTLKEPEFYDDKDGNKRISLPVTATSINFLPTGKSDRAEGSPAGSQAGSQAGSYGQPAAAGYGAAPAGAQGGFGGYQSRPQQQQPYQQQQRSYAAAQEPAYSGSSASKAGSQPQHTFGSSGSSFDEDALESESEDDMPF
jgi:single-strand DNA-binding protein